MVQESEISHWGRVWVGCLGGLLVLTNKIVSQGASGLKTVFEDLARDKDAMFQFLGYVTIAIGTVAITAGIAWAVAEKSRLKLMAVAVSAPALISAWGAVPEGLGTRSLAFITPAFAQTSAPTTTPAQSFWRGVELFFSGAPEIPKYRVVVASAQSPDEAAAIATKLRQVAPMLQTAVADKAPGNPYFAVVASDFLSYAKASDILAEVKKTPLGSNAYLSVKKANSTGLIQ